MNKGLRNEIMLLGMLGSLGALLLGKRKLAAGLAASSAALLLKDKLTAKIESFYGKTILITGGSRGLGLALAKELIQSI